MTFREWFKAFDDAVERANLLKIDQAIRKTKEYGKTVFSVSSASKNDSDYALSEIVKPGTPPRKK